MLRGQFFEGGIGDWFDCCDLFEGSFHRISKYLKIASSNLILQFYQMEHPGQADQKVRCLALQRVKARLIKDNFINEGSIDRQDFVAKQVIKYSTLLSEKMLDRIKTQDLKEFEKDVQDYCRQSQKMNQVRRSKNENLKQINVSQLLREYKDSTKMRLLQNNKKRTKTSQSFELAVGPGRLATPEPLPLQSKIQSPLGNKKIREAIQQNKKRIIPISRFLINGKGVNSQIIQLLEKMNQIQSIQKLRKRRQFANDQEDEYLQGRSNILKKEQERLSTAFQNQQRSKFKPMGRIKKEPRVCNDRNQYKIQELDYLKKLHNRGGGNRVLMLQPLKKSQIIVSSNFVGKASIHLQQGLPSSIKNQIPIKKIKKSQGYINLNEIQKPQTQAVNNEGATPTLLLPNNRLFVSEQFS